ncbi:MAG TPA: energy transducer TonB [Bryobacteraceae bacterium]|nr:energy transducer TonB [Bryobacteraceae bacterium]
MHKLPAYAATLVMLLTFAPLASAELRVASDDALKAATKKAPPEYPAMAKQLKISGKVEVDVTIDAGGNVENVTIVSGNAMLTPSVVTAVKRWKFTPFTQDGAPAKAVAQLRFDFKM